MWRVERIAQQPCGDCNCYHNNVGNQSCVRLNYRDLNGGKEGKEEEGPRLDDQLDARLRCNQVDDKRMDELADFIG